MLREDGRGGVWGLFSAAKCVGVMEGEMEMCKDGRPTHRMSKLHVKERKK